MTQAARPSRQWGYAAAVWAAVFAILHFYWALGGTVGLAESAGEELADERPTWFVVGGLYGVALALVPVAVLGCALARSSLSGRRRCLPLLGAGVAAVLMVRAVVVEVLLLTDVDYGNGAIGSNQRCWTLVLWNPWFLVGGLAFAMATLASWLTVRGPGSPSTVS